MRTPEDIVFMLKAGPGRYAISSDPALMTYVMVEVDEHHRVHQLNSKNQRDGVLSKDGWLTDVKVYTVTMKGETTVFKRIGYPEVKT